MSNRSLRFAVSLGVLASVSCALMIACSDDDTTPTGGTPTSPTLDASPSTNDTGAATTNPGTDSGSGVVDTGAADAGKILPVGMLDPIPYLSKADNPLIGVNYPMYFHLEDWETGALKAPGVTPGVGYSVVTGGDSLTDSVDGDDGVLDDKCKKPDGGFCSSAFGGGTLEFTFDEAVLGALPTHVGIAWTDGSSGCDAIFEAYGPDSVTPLGTKTAAAVGDPSNSGTTAEDRFFGVVATVGVKRIVVKSSGGGVEVDHLTYGR